MARTKQTAAINKKAGAPLRRKQQVPRALLDANLQPFNAQRARIGAKGKQQVTGFTLSKTIDTTVTTTQADVDASNRNASPY